MTWTSPCEDWSLTSLKEKLIKIGAKVVSHGRYVAFQTAEVAIPRNLFTDILLCGRRTKATAHYIHSVRRSIVMRSMQSVGKVRLDDGKHNIFRSPAARRRPIL